MPKGTRPKWVEENAGKHVCRCGCGGVIPLRPEHYPNVPQFLHGHNAKADPPRKPVFKPVLACKCGCGEMATPGRQYISGHNNLGQKRSDETRAKLRAGKLGELNPHYGKLGPENPSWRGGILQHTSGYLLEYSLDHPYAVKRYVMQHRLVAERSLRVSDPGSPFLIKVDGVQYLRPEVDVHHRNEVRDDNRIENLEVMLKGDHTRYHQLAKARTKENR